ncbi:c-type cytochrome domain-containing protein [Maribacter sp. HTCC2170]|uniref:c-type cytochrome domain-containing protein n=1 Tax=Maribacter sp. (strain HTCC2170 / KCCM 42371) TaxID=313603 RepID=UPI00006AE5D0|nr:c-type cytochrome domain-containing protein [Maribacter sp. HTCC2170]EAR00616.1 hypothetical protein FB2170_08924 [Maribacter sp. HTCC2170]
MDIIKQLLGRLHPLLVHLPIGFIVLGLLLQWYNRKKGQYSQAITLIYFWATISAVLACITGYLQYTSEGYAFDTIKSHLWLGIITALFSFLMYLRLTEKNKIDIIKRIPTKVLVVIILILISCTGHLGGNITHGADYLVEPLPNSMKSALGFETYEEKIITLNNENWEDKIFYEDIIDPILNNKCVSCHNPKKAKGELILSTKEGILNGGENGEIILANNSSESDLFTRLILPDDDEDHMPPKEKKQLTKEDVKLIETWIDMGNPFEATIGELEVHKELFLAYFPKEENYDYPNIAILEANIDSINAIKKVGFHVEKISKESNFLRVSCVNKPDFSNDNLSLLKSITEQIAVLDIGKTLITDNVFEDLSKFPHITILKLDNTLIDGSKVEQLSKLAHLKSLNLTSTKFNASNLKKLESIENLKQVFLHNTNIDPQSIQNLNLPQVIIDLGNYELPGIASDSIIY